MNADRDDETLDQPSEFERRLLTAARTERPSAELSARMAHALGLPAPPAVAPPLEAAKGIFSSWVGLSAFCIVAASALVWALWPERTATPVESGSTHGASLHAEVQPMEGASTETAPSAAPLSPEPSSRVASPVLKPALSAAPPRGDLREEIRLIDAARSAVATHAPNQALALLQRYSATYPGGVFGQEASVLRIEALNQSGEHSRAKALAREFLARHSNSPLAERAERVLK